MNDLPKIVSFSGGHSSGYMLWRLIQQYPDFRERFRVVFENTGKEHNATLDFVHEVETRWRVPITWLQYTRVDARTLTLDQVKEGKTQTYLAERQDKGETTHWWREVNYETAARHNTTPNPFDELLEWATVLPNVKTRMCSVQLKVRTRDRYLYAQGVRDFEAYIGIRGDEPDRPAEILANIGCFEKPRFPLFDARVTKAQVEDFWDTQPFRLRIPNRLGNCTGCFLKARWKRVLIAKEDPVAIKWWADWEDRRTATTYGDGGRWDRRKGNSWAAIIEEANSPTLALDYEEPDTPCSCAIGGYRYAQTDENEDPA